VVPPRITDVENGQIPPQAVDDTVGKPTGSGNLGKNEAETVAAVALFRG
jgi:hypothetical protein